MGEQKRTGHCLCKKVSIEVPVHKNDIGACHCSMYRTWSSGPFLAVHGGVELAVTGKEHISTYASSEWAERAFCTHCGTNLYYKLLPTGEYFVSAGVFGALQPEGVADFNLASEIFIDEKPTYYGDLSKDSVKKTGAEVMESAG